MFRFPIPPPTPQTKSFKNFGYIIKFLSLCSEMLHRNSDNYLETFL